MPTQQTRPSLTTDLASRYDSQKIGGAFNAHNIIETGIDSIAASYQGAQFQKGNGFLTKEAVGVSNFKNDGNGLSSYSQGLDTKPYKK